MIFESLAQWVEPIDIDNEEYRFCDEKGQRYVGVMVRAVGRFGAGTFEFRAEGQPEVKNAADLVDQATGVAPNKWHKDLASLRRHLTSA